MLGSYRLPIFALIGLILVAVSGALAQPPNILGKPHSQEPASESDSDSSEKTDNPQKASRTPPEGNAIKTEADQKVAGEDKRHPNCEFGSIQECDLAAQQSMAESTASMNKAAWIGLGFTLFGLALIWRTLYYTGKAASYARDAAQAGIDAVEEARNATKAAQEAVVVTREMGEAQTRAYLTVTGGEVVYDLGRKPSAFITVKNSGHSPAYNVTAIYQIGSKTNFDATPKAAKGLKVKSIPLAHTIEAGLEDRLAIGLVDEALTGVSGPSLAISLEGLLEYQTVFGIKTGEVDMSAVFLLLHSVRKETVNTSMMLKQFSRHEMVRVTAFVPGWISGYRAVVSADREHQRREQESARDN